MNPYFRLSTASESNRGFFNALIVLPCSALRPSPANPSTPMASLFLPSRPPSQALAVPRSSYGLRTRSFLLRSSRLVSTPRPPKGLFFLNFEAAIARKHRTELGGKIRFSPGGHPDVEWGSRNEEFNPKEPRRLLKFAQSNKEIKTDIHVLWLCTLSCGITSWLSFAQAAQSSEGERINMVYEIGELFELGIQLSYLLILLGLLGLGSFFVIRQVLVRRELDLSAKELQDQVRSGDATATEYFELGAVMLRRKFYPAAAKYLQQAIEKWDRDDQDLAQVYNALGVSFVRDNKLDKGIAQFEKAVKLQPGYVTAWNNLGDAYEKKKDLRSALKAFEEVLLFDPNNKVARPRRDTLRDRVQLYKGVPLKSEER